MLWDAQPTMVPDLSLAMNVVGGLFWNERVTSRDQKPKSKVPLHELD